MKIYMIVLLIVTSNIISGSENCWQPRVFTAHRECQKCGESRPWTDTFCSNCMTNLKLKHDRYDLSVEELERLQADGYNVCQKCVL